MSHPVYVQCVGPITLIHEWAGRGTDRRNKSALCVSSFLLPSTTFSLSLSGKGQWLRWLWYRTTLTSLTWTRVPPTNLIGRVHAIRFRTWLKLWRWNFFFSFKCAAEIRSLSFLLSANGLCWTFGIILFNLVHWLDVSSQTFTCWKRSVALHAYVLFSLYMHWFNMIPQMNTQWEFLVTFRALVVSFFLMYWMWIFK